MKSWLWNYKIKGLLFEASLSQKAYRKRPGRTGKQTYTNCRKMVQAQASRIVSQCCYQPWRTHPAARRSRRKIVSLAMGVQRGRWCWEPARIIVLNCKGSGILNHWWVLDAIIPRITTFKQCVRQSSRHCSRPDSSWGPTVQLTPELFWAHILIFTAVAKSSVSPCSPRHLGSARSVSLVIGLSG